MSDLAVGIDLGTTNSCFAYYREGQIKVVENAEGKYTTPSFLFVNGPREVIVGRNAKQISASKPEHGIYGMKRFIGKSFTEIEEQLNLQNFAFVIKNVDGKPLVFIEKYNKYLSPIEISTFVLQKVKKDACDKLKKKLNRAVITVPAHFSVSQREDTLKAAKEAGFTVLKLLNEPTAAALDYFYQANGKQVEINPCLVYDLGGGTFDVAILQRNNECIEVVSVDGDSHLGGQDFDNLILNFISGEIYSRYNVDVKTEKRLVRRLRNEAESAKEALSTTNDAHMILEGVIPEVDVCQITLTRTQFEEMSEELFQRSIDIVDRCIHNANLRKQDIGKVILAGGSTRIPKIQQLLRDYFNGKALLKILNPEECVARGAALQAAMLSNHSKQKVKKFTIKEVTSSSLGIGDITNRMNFLIKKNTKIPTSGSVTHATINDQQLKVYFKVFEGESMHTTHNRFLGKLEVTDLTPAPPGKCKIIVTMNIDGNGILTTTAQEQHKNNIKNLQIALFQGNGVKKYIPQVDYRFAEFSKIKEYLIMYCARVQYNISKKGLLGICQLLYDISRNSQMKFSRMEVNEEQQLLQQGAKLMRMCEATVREHNFKKMPNNSDIERKLKNVVLPIEYSEDMASESGSIRNHF